MTTPDDLVPRDDAERRKIARKVAAYELADSGWADMIIDAYLFPSTAYWGDDGSESGS